MFQDEESKATSEARQVLVKEEVVVDVLLECWMHVLELVPALAEACSSLVKLAVRGDAIKLDISPRLDHWPCQLRLLLCKAMATYIALYPLIRKIWK